MQTTRQTTRRRLGVGVVLMIAVAALVPVAVSASHTFSDVPDTNIFHDDITWLADANVTKGCNPPTNDMFCPADNVTREQMAAFMRRLAEGKVVDAATAVEADHAVAADNATNAAAATDADMLDGMSSEAFQQMSGAVSCSSSSFRAFDSLMDYDMGASDLYRTSTDGSGIFRCSMDIPHGATVTAVHFSVYDNDAAADVRRCEMWRTNLITDIGTELEMADAGATTGQPGDVVLSSITIEGALIDNSQYAYFTQCTIDGTTFATAIWGVSVEFGGGSVIPATPAKDAATGASSG